MKRISDRESGAELDGMKQVSGARDEVKNIEGKD